jgi:dTDP-4-dehydrorhamnose reductase
VSPKVSVKLPLLVVGAAGLIGRPLVTHWVERGESVIGAARGKGDLPIPTIQLDLADNAWPPLPRCSAAVICAAITRQELCRQDPAATRHINVVRTLELIGQLVDAGAFVVFLSTNLVFDGTRPQRRSDEPLSPRMEYGRQKAEVEEAMRRWAGRVAVVRITKVFYPQLPLLQKWLQDLDAGYPVNAFSDYFCAPVSLGQVVAGIGRIATEERSGVWQFSGPKDVSYAQLALEVARLRGANAALIQSVRTPPGLLEHHPAHTTLDASRAAEELGLVFSEPAKVLKECLRRFEAC